MGHEQMLRVSMTDGWLNRPGGTDTPRPGTPAQGARVHDHNSVVIRSHGEDCRRSSGEPGVSGPSPGERALRLHLAMIPPGTRGTPHFHADRETAIYVVSGEADVWHGPDLGNRSAVRAGDFIYIPPGTPHLAVNRGDVTSIAVVARTDPADQPGAVVIELPRHLAALSDYPVGLGE
jgi:uncharacterized RmlC-like cupin family protein